MQIPKVIKITSLIIGAILALLVLVVIIAPFLIDSDTYKAEIARYVKETTGRNLTIDDDIELSVFPWIGFTLGTVTLDNSRDFSPQVFASIDQASVRVKLLPLLKQQIEVDKITLHGLVLHLQINEQGISNWDDLIPVTSSAAETPSTTATQSEAATSAAPFAALVIGGIDLRNAHLTWDDRQINASYVIDKLNLSSSLISLNQPFDIDSDFRIESPEVQGDITLKSQLTIDLNRQRYRADKLSLKGKLSGEAVPGGKMEIELDSDINADLKQQTLKISALQLKGLGLKVTGDVQGREILGSPKFEGDVNILPFKPRDLLNELALPPMETTDPEALKNASLQIQFNASDDALKITRLSGKLDETSLDATASIQNFANPVIELKARIDAIDVDRYLSPTAETGAATPASAAAAGALNLPVDDLRALNVQGSLAIGSAKISGLTVQDFSMRITARNGLINLTPIKAALYQGQYSGNMTLDVRKNTPRFMINEKLSGIQAEPLLKDLMEDDLLSGRGDISVKLTSLGNDIEAIQRNLNGNAAFAFREGAVKGINLAQLIRKAKAILKNKPLPTEKKQQQTDFTELSGTIQIAKGIASNSDLSARSPYFRISGKGKADLINEKIDYLLHAKIVGTGIGQAEKELADLKGIDIPIRIKGPLSAPTYQVDAQFITNLLRNKAEKRLKKKLTKEQDAIIKEVEEKLQDTLKGLFK